MLWERRLAQRRRYAQGRFFDHDHTIVGNKRYRLQVFALARPGKALAAFYLKERAVCGANNKRSVGVQELVFFPLKWCAKMRATIPIQKYLIVFLHGEHVKVINFDSL